MSSDACGWDPGKGTRRGWGLVHSYIELPVEAWWLLCRGGGAVFGP